MWTSGFTLTPAAGVTSGWMWNMTSHVIPLTYSSAWNTGEPNNFGGRNENKIIMRNIGDGVYKFYDVLSVLGTNDYAPLSYVCEYDL